MYYSYLFFAICYVIHSVIGQTYTQWTGYGYISDITQLSSTTPFRIRHIGGKYLYQNIDNVDPGAEYFVYGGCTLD